MILSKSVGRLASSVKRGFLTCNTSPCGSNGKPKRWVEVEFKTLEEAQVFHNRLIEVLSLSQGTKDAADQ